MEFKDYYKILELSKKATDSEIKKQYRKLARKYHPDVNKEPDAEKKFKDIAEAYEVLKDKEKRKAYDTYGADWKDGPKREKYQRQYQQQGFDGNAGGFNFGGDFEGAADYSDFFQSFFGGRGGRASSRAPRKQQGGHVNATIHISLEDSYSGGNRKVSFSIPETNKAGHQENKVKHLNIAIPKGVKDGQKIRLKGQGSAGVHGGAKGDMYITVHIEPHNMYRIDGTDVYLNLPLAPWEAALGMQIMIPLPVGNIKLNIPKDTYSGKKLRLKGKGIPSKVPGDFYVVVQIVIPSSKDPKAVKLYEEMKNLDFNPRANFKN